MSRLRSISRVVVRKLTPLVVLSQLACQPSSDSLSPQEFYSSRVLEIIVPTSAGGGYDTWARMVAPELSKKINGTVIVRNMSGAGGLLALNHMYNSARKDGSVLGIGMSIGPYVNQILQTEAVRYDLRKFNWLGRFTYDDWGLSVGTDLGVKTLDELSALPNFKIGALSKYDNMGLRGIIFLEALQLSNGRVIGGYPGSSNVNMAILRNEVDATCVSIASALDSYTANHLLPVVAVSETRLPEIPDAPTIFEERQLSDEAREWLNWEMKVEQAGRTFLLPPGVDSARVEYLREALRSVLQDTEFVEAALRRQRFVRYLPGPELLELISDVIDVGPEEREELNQMLEKYF